MKERVRHVVSLMKKHSTLLKLIFLASVLFFVVNQITGIIQGMTLQDLLEILTSQSKWRLLLMTCIGFLGTLPMMLYDKVTTQVLTDYGAKKMTSKEFFLAAWTTNTINNMVGFGGVIGATLRANFYGKDVSKGRVVATVSKVALFMLTGLSILCTASLIDVTLVQPENPYGEYWIWLLGGSVVAPALFVFTRIKKKSLFKDFNMKRILKLYLASIGQWLGAMSAFLLIGYLLEAPVSMLEIYPLFVAATFIGMLSLIPGGMGTFDVMMILGLGQVGVSKEFAVAWLLYYRLFYYLIPFISGLLLFFHRTSARINQFFDGLPKMALQKAAHLVLVVMLYFAGIMMVLLSTVPNLSNISRFFSFLTPFSFDFLDQTLNMLIGVLLIGLARGISSKVQRAYFPTLVVLLFCLINTISRTVSLRLMVVFAVLLICVYLSRKEFYRKQFIYSWGAMLCDGVLLAGLLILYAVVGFYASDNFQHMEPTPNFLLFPSEDVWISGMLGLIVSLGIILLLFQYLSKPFEKLGIPYQKERVNQLISRYGGGEISHLLFLKDKKHYFYQENGQDEVLFMFQRQGNKCFVLGNPVGNGLKWKEATVELMTRADQLGYQLAFYQITEEYVMVLHDIGFHFMKAGEEGNVNVGQLTMKQCAGFTEKTEVHRLLKQGYSFQMLPAPLYPEMLNELESISDEWLSGNGEKYFSVGRFKREFIKEARVGIVRAPNHQIIAFACVWQMEGQPQMSYDLLRYRRNAPEEIRDFIVAHLLCWAKEQHAEVFHLGMAPLANVGNNRFAFTRERFVDIFYRYGYRFYGFQDLRLRKELYATAWEGRYFAYQKNSSVLFAFMQLIRLIGRGRNTSSGTLESAMIE